MKRPTLFAISIAVPFSSAVALAQRPHSGDAERQAATTQSMPSMAQMDEHMTVRVQEFADRVRVDALPCRIDW